MRPFERIVTLKSRSLTELWRSGVLNPPIYSTRFKLLRT
ncbi:hypothetical protein CKA32_001141 [Geitlerinema sp. FC II]|nr:hypothetical protein CKA32_001141 [Geitlerinema sp. FC II]